MLLDFLASLLDRRSHSRRPGSCRSRWGAETLEGRALLATLAVDINDAACANAGDDLYCEIQDAVDAASSGDTIEVNNGTYAAVEFSRNDLTIRNAKGQSPVIDGQGAAPTGVWANGNRVRIFGLTAINSDIGFLVNGRDSVVVGNMASHNNYGFIVDGAHHVLTGNVASSNTVVGFVVQGVNHGVGSNVSSANGVGGFQILVSGQFGSPIEGFSQFSDNVATGNADFGFHIGDGENGNVFTANRASENEIGFEVRGDSNTLVNNTANDNTRTGYILSGAMGNMLTDNNASDNGEDGFRLSGGSQFNALTKNLANGNGENGFSTLGPGGITNSLDENAANGNGIHGFYITGSLIGDSLFRNTAANNLADGFHVELGGHTLEGNTSKSNLGNGFWMATGNGIGLIGNTAVRNSLYGFSVETVSTLFSSDNECRRNGSDGDDQGGAICG